MGEFSVVIANGEALEKYNCMITLNSSGVFLWKLLEKGADKEQLLKEMLAEYNVEEKVAKEHIDLFLDKLKKADILE